MEYPMKSLEITVLSFQAANSNSLQNHGNGLSYSPPQVFGNRRLKTRLPTTTQLLDATIPTANCLTESTEAAF